jgi:hypothetical protein
MFFLMKSGVGGSWELALRPCGYPMAPSPEDKLLTEYDRSFLECCLCILLMVELRFLVD